jgi:hypothetical protein
VNRYSVTRGWICGRVWTFWTTKSRNLGSDSNPSAENTDCGLEWEADGSVEAADTEVSALRLGVPIPESKRRNFD